MTPLFPNEFSLLLEASKKNPSFETVSAYLQREIDYELLLNLSISHGVFPLLYNVLKHMKKTSMLQELEVIHNRLHKSSFFITALLLQLIYKLNEKKIRCIPLKGAVLAQSAYGDIALRPFGDIDILIQEKDMLYVVDTLSELGYTCEHNLKATHHPYILEHYTDISFIHPHTGLYIEVHWKLFNTAIAGLSDIPALFDKSTNISIQGMRLNKLPQEEEFIYLCIHAAKHRFERLEWLNDLNYLYEKYHHVYDWKRMYQLACDEQMLKPYLLSLKLLHHLYQCDTPNVIDTKLLYSSKIIVSYQKVCNLYRKNYILKQKKNGIRWMEFFFALQLDDTFLQKFHRIKQLLFPQYIDDILSYNDTEKKLGPGYYFKRLQRFLFKRHI